MVNRFSVNCSKAKVNHRQCRQHSPSASLSRQKSVRSDDRYVGTDHHRRWHAEEMSRHGQNTSGDERETKNVPADTGRTLCVRRHRVLLFSSSWKRISTMDGEIRIKANPSNWSISNGSTTKVNRCWRTTWMSTSAVSMNWARLSSLP